MTTDRPNGLASSVPRGAEFTWQALVLGLVLSVVMGAANVYLGLRAGMTVSASIPAAVISLGILRGIFGRKSILESNLVQTAASAGESLSAGIIFTMPALLLTGAWQHFDYWTTTLIALSGGLLGVLLMIPMRQVFVVDNRELKFPEGVACAEVLRAGTAEASESERRGALSGLRLVLSGIAVGSGFKLLQSYFGLLAVQAEWATARLGRVFYLGADISPALLAVGFIVTLPIAVQIFAGGALSWLVAIPWLSAGGDAVDSSLDAVQRAHELWSTKVRYLGVGAMVVGGLTSIWTVRDGLWAAARQLLRLGGPAHEQHSTDVTQRNLAPGSLLGLGIVAVAIIAGIYLHLLQGAVGLALLMTVLMLILSFFFTAVASYLVGLVGASNSPVSGMTITALLGAGGVIWLMGYSGNDGIIAALGVAGVVCCVTCTSGDVCNDLKTGYLIGASPRLQQIAEILGVIAGAFVMAPVMTVLHEGSLRAGGGGIGGQELPAPQAGLFAAIAKGIFSDEGTLPKAMVAWGAVIGLLLLLVDRLLLRLRSPLRLHVMPVAVGMYLPFGLSVPILLGGLIHALVTQSPAERGQQRAQRGVLVASGLIAGESLLGVLLGLFAYLGVPSLSGADWLLGHAGLAESARVAATDIISLLALGGVAAALWRWSNR